MTQQYSFRLALILALVLACGIPSLWSSSVDEATAAHESGTRFVAYYFHGNVRCSTCRKLEAYAEEAITKGFANELASGDLKWRVVNTDESENKHFVEDFELLTKAVVLVEYRDGEVVRFQNLKLVWQLVGEKDGFLKYVRDATSAFLEKE